MSVRHLLLDLEAGRWRNDPEGALEFLATKYVEFGDVEAWGGECEELRKEIAELQAENDILERENYRLKDKLRKIAGEVSGEL